MIPVIDFVRSCPNFPILSPTECLQLRDLLQSIKPDLFSSEQVDVLLALVVCFQDLLDSTEPVRVKDIQFILKSSKVALMHSLDEFSSFGIFAPQKEINVSLMQSKIDFLFLHLFKDPRSTFLTPTINEYAIPFICVLIVNFNLKDLLPFPDMLKGCINGIRIVKDLPTVCKKIATFISSSLISNEKGLNYLMEIFHQSLETDFETSSLKLIKILTTFPSFLTKKQYIENMTPKLRLIILSNSSSRSMKQVSAEVCIFFASIEPLIVFPTSAYSWIFSKDEPQLEQFLNQILFIHQIISYNDPSCLVKITESNSFVVSLIYFTISLWTSLCEIVTVAKDLLKVALEILPEEHLKFSIVQGFLLCTGIEDCKYSFDTPIGSDSQIIVQPVSESLDFSLIITRFKGLLQDKYLHLFSHIFLELSSRKERNQEKIKQILLAVFPLIEQTIAVNRAQSLIFIQSFLEIFTHGEKSLEEFLATIYAVIPSIIFNPAESQEFSQIEVCALNRIYQLLIDQEGHKDLKAIIEESLKTKVEIPQSSFMSNPLQEIYNQIADSSVPIKAQGLVALKKHIQRKNNIIDPKTVQEIYLHLQEALKEQDSFAYLHAIKCMESLAYSYHDQIVPLLICNLNASSSSKSIEVLAKIIESFGSFFSKYADSFVQRALSILYDSEAQELLKAEILSLTSLVFEHNPYALCSHSNQLILYCLYVLDRITCDIEAKKGALVVLKHLIAGGGREICKVADQQFIQRSIGTLQTYAQDPDPTLKMHANEALYHLERLFTH